MRSIAWRSSDELAADADVLGLQAREVVREPYPRVEAAAQSPDVGRAGLDALERRDRRRRGSRSRRRPASRAAGVQRAVTAEADQVEPAGLAQARSSQRLDLVAVATQLGFERLRGATRPVSAISARTRSTPRGSAGRPPRPARGCGVARRRRRAATTNDPALDAPAHVRVEHDLQPCRVEEGHVAQVEHEDG